jgi:eukaryotic-like serine/threonine-protein kinase
VQRSAEEPTPDWQQVKDVFAGALERVLAERDAYLTSRCAGDLVLEGSVRDLLAALEEAPDFLESRDPVDRAALSALGLDERPALDPGARMGPYEVLDLLDAGGMGEVYRARDHRLRRDVALKVLHRGPGGDAGARLSAEARAAAAINDPNVVAVFDVGEAAGVPFVVTELLDGETLGRRLRRGPVEAQEAVALGIEIARGLAAVHAQGLVHRDLKPDNVFLTRQGGVKLLDFGVAKALHGPAAIPSATGAVAALEPSTVMGTPGYVAPEQLDGHPSDARADVFALGAVLHRMLGPRTSALGAPREPLPATVPVELARVVERCLARAPERRFQSAEEARRALESVAAAPRRRWRRAGAAAAAAAAGVAAVLALRAPGPDRRAETAVRSLVVLPLEDASGASGGAFLGAGITEGLTAQIARTRALRVLSRTTVAALARGATDPATAARELGVDAILAGSVRRSGQRVRIDLRLDGVETGARLWEGTYEGALHEVPALLRTSTAALTAELAGEAPSAAAARSGPRSDAAYEAFLRGRHLWNLRSGETVPQAVAEFNRALQQDPLYASAYTGLADALATLGDMLHSMPHREAFARAEAAARRALALDPSEAEAHATLGHMRMHAWRWAEADREFRLAIEKSPGHAPAHQWRAYNLASQGRLAEAVHESRTAEQLDPLSPIIAADVAQILYFAGRDEEAVAQARQTLLMNPSFAEARRILFLALLRAGRRAEAARELEAYVRHPDGGPGGSVGFAYARLGRRADAQRTIARLQARPRGRFVPPYDLAVIHAGLGERDRAFARLEEAVSTNDPESMILPVDPRLSALRGDPRFAAVLLRMDVE